MYIWTIKFSVRLFHEIGLRNSCSLAKAFHVYYEKMTLRLLCDAGREGCWLLVSRMGYIVGGLVLWGGGYIYMWGFV